MTKQIAGFTVCLFITFLAATIGSVASIEAADFYQQLERPIWAPPASLFGPTWTMLHLLMAVSVWLIWRERDWQKNKFVFLLFLTQLALNSLWSWLFFKWKLGGIASIEILILWLAILLTIIFFWKIKPLAGMLMLPYLAWVSFAAVLCYTTWKLNPTLL